MEIFGQIGSAIMTPLYYAVSAVLLAWHWVFEQIPGLNDGWTWVLSIVGLTITIRAMLIPLFVKQIRSSRNMQLLQPKIRELQKKYAHDREKLTQEQMKLWKETGTNPFASCLPLLAQMPIFFALFRTIDQAAKNGGDGAKGFMSADDADSLQSAIFLGGKIADTFMNAEHVETRILAISLVIIMCATQFLTQRQLMAKNMPPEALNGPYAQQQKMLMYILPPVFAFGGIFFPIGVLFYWVTSNAWTGGQQFYIIRRNPAPGTPAFKAKQQRDAAKGRASAIESGATEIKATETPKPRTQPKKQSRNQRKKGGR